MRKIPAALEKLAGREFMERLRAAVARIRPMPQEVLDALSQGPEVSGGMDIEPEDVFVETLRPGQIPVFSFDYGSEIAYVDTSRRVRRVVLPWLRPPEGEDTCRYEAVLVPGVTEADEFELRNMLFNDMPDADEVRIVRGALGTAVFAVRSSR